jgi:hypothetical protein
MMTPISRILVKTLLFVLSVAGVLGALVLGFIGIRAGAHGELERILAIVCIALAAGASLGVWGADGKEDAEVPFLTVGDRFTLLVSAPLLLFCAGVFVATLIPAWYVIVPTFAMLWGAVFGRAPRGVSAPPPAAHGEVHAPAYV